MTISTYIPSNDDIRAVLGVGVKELTDKTLGLDIYDLKLEESLTALYAGLPDIYAELVAKKKANEKDPQTNPPLTKNERRVVGLTQVYATYAVAASVAPTLKGFGVKSLTDGKAEFERFQDAFNDVLEAVKLELLSLGTTLLGALEEIGETIPVVEPVFFIATATLGTDPVTGA